MNNIAVITCDVIKSTSIAKKSVVSTLLINSFETIQKKINISFEYQVFRGDSFQIVLENWKYALRIVIALKALFRQHQPESSIKNYQFDARFAISIGPSSESERKRAISERSGPTYVCSGHLLDGMDKKLSTIIFDSPKKEIKQLCDLLKMQSLWADKVISNWSPQSAECFDYYVLDSLNQKEIAAKLGVSSQAISKRMRVGNIDDTIRWIEHFEQLKLDLL